MSDFPEFMKKVAPFLGGEVGDFDERELKALLCADCEFFTPGEDEELECGCYRMLIALLRGGKLTIREISDAIR